MVECQIEKANLAELDWALAHMDSASGSSSSSKASSKELAEADSKLGKEDVRSISLLCSVVFDSFLQGQLKGLGALLFDDGLLLSFFPHYCLLR